MRWYKTFSLAVLSVLLFASPWAIAEEEVMEGVHYLRITPAQPTNAPKGKVEITELFWYGCPHCFRFEPQLNAWLKKKPDGIVFNRVPSPLNPKWEIHSRVFYAAEALGLTDKIHEPFFNAIHIDRKPLFTEDAILDFIASVGVDRKKFAAAMKSFSVSSKVRYALKLGRSANATGVPALIVNGKYLLDGKTAGSHASMIRLAEQLARQELKDKASESR